VLQHELSTMTGISSQPLKMHPLRFPRTIFLLGLAVAAVLPVFQAMGCPVPVYQYALEHWKPDLYQVVVWRDGDFTADQAEALKLLQDAAGETPRPANIEVTVSDVEPGGGTSLELSFPEIARIQSPIWKGELTGENVRKLLSSPLREQLADALLRRTSAVWILLETGNRKTDRNTLALLEGQLERLGKEIVVPDSADWGGETVEIDSNVNFSVLRLDPKDPAEAFTVKMLLAIEADLANFDGQPMVFPVYGRGIVLYAMVGRGIDEHTIRAAAEFLTGPCSCQIKAANPGNDLLVTADWENKIKKLTPAAVGGATGTGSFLRSLDAADAEQENEHSP